MFKIFYLYVCNLYVFVILNGILNLFPDIFL